MAAEPIKRLFSVRDYYRIGKAGVLKPTERVELIEGEIIAMPPIGGPHASHVNRLNWLCVTGVGEAAVVTVQNPLRLDDLSEPVPDLLLLRPRADFYATHPRPADVLLLIEVSDTSLGYDRRVKLPLYARNGVPEVWIVDVVGGTVEVYREPTPDGYRVSQMLRRGERLAPSAFPGLDLAVDDILG